MSIRPWTSAEFNHHKRDDILKLSADEFYKKWHNKKQSGGRVRTLPKNIYEEWKNRANEEKGQPDIAEPVSQHGSAEIIENVTENEQTNADDDYVFEVAEVSRPIIQENQACLVKTCQASPTVEEEHNNAHDPVFCNDPSGQTSLVESPEIIATSTEQHLGGLSCQDVSSRAEISHLLPEPRTVLLEPARLNVINARQFRPNQDETTQLLLTRTQIINKIKYHVILMGDFLAGRVIPLDKKEQTQWIRNIQGADTEELQMILNDIEDTTQIVSAYRTVKKFGLSVLQTIETASPHITGVSLPGLTVECAKDPDLDMAVRQFTIDECDIVKRFMSPRYKIITGLGQQIMAAVDRGSLDKVTDRVKIIAETVRTSETSGLDKPDSPKEPIGNMPEAPPPPAPAPLCRTSTEPVALPAGCV